jgi:hypothetical protein
VTPIVDWLRREPVQDIRSALLNALERCESTAGADALINHFESSGGEGAFYLARVAWRASDKNAATKALETILEGRAKVASSEAAVSLARLGHKYARLTQWLDSEDYYRRLNAALAFAYLDDKSVFEQITAMQREASSPFESIFLAAALAILGKPNGPAELNQKLVAAASSPNIDERVDIFFLHRYLQRAILDALAAGGAPYAELQEAWRAELEPLQPQAEPVALPQLELFPVSGAESSVKSGTYEQGPLNVFISYSLGTISCA